MYTLLDSCLDRIDIFEFLKHVEDGLNDHYDIKMLTYLMLVRLAHLCPNAVLQRKFFSRVLCPSNALLVTIYVIKMYKTAVYTLVNGVITHQKQQISKK